jgi:hypothetical protein
MLRVAILLVFGVFGYSAQAADAPAPSPSPVVFPKTLGTHLSPAEEEQERKDEARFPTLTGYLKTLHLAEHLTPSDPRNAAIISTSHVYLPSPDDWKGFWEASSKDHATCLRAFGILARKIKREGVVVYGPGAVFEKSVNDNKVDLGLALPATNVGTAVWSPNPAITDPEFQLHIKVFYKESYVHKFPDDILPANLKIGFGDPATYWLEGVEYKQPTIDADIYYGPKSGLGFTHVKGIGGQKRGFMGFLQKVLFFLPDAVDSMVIREEKDELVTEAIINTTVKDFEKTPIYSIKIQK